MMKRCLLVIILIFSINIFASNPLRLVDRNDMIANIYFDGKDVTGFICSNSFPFVRVKKRGARTRDLRPALQATGNDFRLNNRYIYGLCKKKFRRVSFFSHRLPTNLRSGAIWKINNRVGFSPIMINKKTQSVGIQYTTYHCPLSKPYQDIFKDKRVFDVKEIAKKPANQRRWGSVNWHHWIEKPINGYYCLTRQPGLIKKHAVQLKNAGIDYLYLDLTNDPRAYHPNGTMTWDFKHKVHLPVMKMIDVYKGMQRQGMAVPQLVVWMGASTHHKSVYMRPHERIVRWVKNKFYPATRGLRFKGSFSKPIVFTKVANPAHYSYQKVMSAVSPLNSIYKVIVKWGKVESFARKKPNQWKDSRGRLIDLNKVWRFKEDCKYKYHGPGGRHTVGPIIRGCKQKSIPDQISIASAFQRNVMSDPNSLGKRGGRTFFQQFQNAFSKRYISITNWNNWLTNRYCYGKEMYGKAGGFAPSLRNPNSFRFHCNHTGTKQTGFRGLPKFVDSFSYEYSRVLEPNQSTGDCHYQLMRALVYASKTNKNVLSHAEKIQFKNHCRFYNLSR